jgi:UDP-3-O-[3-hydroxymyristoyl] N-acetylglucosamine deacetylase
MARFEPFRREGRGIHTGALGAVTVLPRPEASGVVFATDRGEVALVPASLAADARHATDLAAGAARVRTVEHLVAALAWFGVDGARVEVEGAEIPILDGSARPWCEALAGAGCEPGPRFVKLAAKVFAELDGAWGEIVPLEEGGSPGFEVEIDFGTAAVGPPRAAFRPLEEDFSERIAPARTFALTRDIAALEGLGLARGKGLECALAIGDGGPLNPEGMRFPDEPARHKLLDALGDLSILGGVPWARVRLHRPGHALNRALVARAAELLV